MVMAEYLKALHLSEKEKMEKIFYYFTLMYCVSYFVPFMPSRTKIFVVIVSFQSYRV